MTDNPGSWQAGPQDGDPLTLHLDAVRDWFTREQMQTVTRNAGALPPRLLSISSYTPFHRGPGHPDSVPRLYSSLVYRLQLRG